MLEVVGQYTQLKKAGANYMGRWVGPDESSPDGSSRPTARPSDEG